MRLLYRIRQFWLAMGAHPEPDDLNLARSYLTPAELALFLGMQPTEQVHALNVLHKLLLQGEDHPDLLAAALLHDCGKQRSPLNPLERAWIVLAQKMFPSHWAHWGRVGQSDLALLVGWRRPLVVAEQHPAWGAEMARQVGASSLLQALINRHQQDLANDGNDTVEDVLLRKLQIADDEN